MIGTISYLIVFSHYLIFVCSIDVYAYGRPNPINILQLILTLLLITAFLVIFYYLPILFVIRYQGHYRLEIQIEKPKSYVILRQIKQRFVCDIYQNLRVIRC